MYINISTESIVHTDMYAHDLFPLNVMFHITYPSYVSMEDLSAISGLSDRSVDFAKLLSGGRGAIGKQSPETVQMMHRRQ